MVRKLQANDTSIRSGRSPQSRLLCSCAIGAVALSASLAAPRNVYAQSFQGTSSVTLGSATITTGVNTTTVDVGSSAQTVIGWTPSNAASGGVVQFQDAGTTANYTSNLTDYTVLNRILSPVATDQIRFDGNVTSSTGGRIWFYTPGGFIIGSTARFDVGSLVLTTSDISQAGGLLGGAAANQIRFTNADATSRIKIDSLAQLKTSGTDNYLALVAPRIEQGGTLAVQGAVALVAAETATISLNNGLLDISIGTGTADANGIVHTGTTTGIAAATDPKALYMVAVPKNLAVTMLLGGTIGHQAAVASVANGTIILSAGSALNITGDAKLTGSTGAIVDLDNNAKLNASGALTVQAGSGATGKNIDVNIANGGQLTVGGNFTLDASGRGSTLTATGGDIAFNLSASTSGFNVTGATTFDSSALIDGPVPGVNTPASARSGSISVGMTAGNIALGSFKMLATSTIDYSSAIDSLPDDGGSAVSGNAVLNISGPSFTMGALTINASARSGEANLSGGQATAGGTQLSISGGSAVSAGSITLTSSAIGGTSFGTNTQNLGGNATGGSAKLTLNGTLTSTGTLSLAALGTGGDGASGGNGTGGTADVSFGPGQITANRLLLDSTGAGGSVNIIQQNADGGVGGVGRGGTAQIKSVVGGGITLTPLAASQTAGLIEATADGFGGAGGGSSAAFAGGAGGNAFAGTVNLSLTSVSDADPQLRSSLFVETSARGGNGGLATGTGRGGSGGSGSGGITTISFNGSPANFDVVDSENNADGGSGGGSTGGAGGKGGNANAGTSTFALAIDPAWNSLTLSADAFAGNGGNGVSGGNGGDAFNTGSVNFTQSLGKLTIGDTFLSAFAEGGSGGDGSTGSSGSGGSASGGSVSLIATGNGTSIGLGSGQTTALSASGLGGGAGSITSALPSDFANGGNGGNGRGGTVNLVAQNGASITLGGETLLEAQGTGNNGAQGGSSQNSGNGGNAGSGTGGTINISGAGGAITLLASLNALASGQGGIGGFGGLPPSASGRAGNGGNGGGGFGGSITANLRVNSLQSTIILSGGSIGGGGGAGDRGGNGGEARPDAGSIGVDLTFSGGVNQVSNVLVSAVAESGYGGGGVTQAGGSGGNAAGGRASLTIAGDASFALGSFGRATILSTTNGFEGSFGRGGGRGGDATGGTARLSVVGQAVIGDASVNAETSAGRGGSGAPGENSLLLLDGGAGGAGGNATGGQAGIFVTGTLRTQRLPGVFASTSAGFGGDGGVGFNGGSGGAGGAGGNGGTVLAGGTAEINVDGGSFTALDAGTDGPIQVFAISRSGAGGRNGEGFFGKPNGAISTSGNATGGVARFSATNATIALTDIEIRADGFGFGNDNPVSAPERGALGQGGSAEFLVDNSSITAPTIVLSANGFGGAIGQNGPTTVGPKGGNGLGGQATFALVGIDSILDVSSIDVMAQGFGGEGGSAFDNQNNVPVRGGDGGDGIGGTALFTVDVDSASDFFTIKGNVTLDTRGLGGNGGSGSVGGTGGLGLGGGMGSGSGQGSRFELTAGELIVRSLDLVSLGTGGRAGFSSAGAGGFGGAGTGGKATISADGPTADLTVDSVDFSIDGVGGNGTRGIDSNAFGFAGGNGGDATGGSGIITSTNGALLDFTVPGGFRANATGGTGGQGGLGQTGGTGGAGGAAVGGSLLLISQGQSTLSNAGLIADVSALGGTGGQGGIGLTSFTGAPASAGVDGLNGATPGASGTDGGAGQAGLNGANGGAGGNGGTGGSAIGGSISITGNQSDISIGANFDSTLKADGRGGVAGAGGVGGNGGNGQQGGVGGKGGNGAQGAPESGYGTGGFPGGNGGNGGAGGNGGNGGNGGRGGDAGLVGQGTGGEISFESTGGRLVFGNLDVTVNGIGGASADGGAGGIGGASGLGGLGGAFGLGGAGGAGTPVGAAGKNGVAGANGTAGASGSGAFAGNSSSLSTSTGGTISILSNQDSNGNGGAISLGATTLSSIAMDDDGFVFGVPGSITISNLNRTASGPDLKIDSLDAAVDGFEGFGGASGIFLVADQSKLAFGDSAFLDSAKDIRLDAIGTGQFLLNDRIEGDARGLITVTHTGQPGNLETILAEGGITFNGNLGIDAQSGTILEGKSGGINLFSTQGAIFTDDLRARYDIRAFAAGDLRVNNVLTRDPILGSTFDTVDLRAGYQQSGAPSFVPATLTIDGTVTSSSDILAQSGGNIVVGPNARLSAANSINFASGDDIIIGDGAVIKSSQNPSIDAGYGTSTDIIMAAGGISAVGAVPDEVNSFVAGSATFEAPGSAIKISAHAIQAFPATFSSASFSTLIFNGANATGRDDNGQLSGNCVEGNVCLGNVNATDLLSISQPSNDFGLANKVFITGKIDSNNTSISSRDTMTFNAGGGNLTINGTSTLFLESTQADIVFNGPIAVTGGLLANSFVVSAGNGSILGQNATLNSSRDIALAARQDIILKSIVAAGALGTYQFDSSPDPFINILGTFAASDQIRIGAGNLDITAKAGITIGDISVPNLANIRLMSLGDVSLKRVGAAGFGTPKNIIVNGNNINFATIDVSGDVNATATGAIAGTSIGAGNDVNLTSGNSVTLTSVKGLGTDGASQVTISGATGITLSSTDVKGDVGLTANNGNISVSNDQRATGTVNATAKDIILNALGNLTLGTANATAGNLAVTSQGVLAINALAMGTAIDFRSSDIAIGATAQIGALGTTSGVSLTNIGGRQAYIGGNGGTSTFGLSNAELQRVFANNISIVATSGQPTQTTVPDVVLDTLTLSGANGQQGATAGNIGTNGQLQITAQGRLRTIGAVTLNNLGTGNNFVIQSSNMIEIDPATGSIALRTTAGGLGGTLVLNSDNIISASAAAQGDVFKATDIAAVNTRLATNDGTTNDAGVLQANAISVTARLGFYVQNTGLTSNAADLTSRRGITVGSGGLKIETGSTNTRIVINGRQAASGGGFTAGIDWIPLIQFFPPDSSQPGRVFNAGSTVNGCVILNPASCVSGASEPKIDPVNSARDIIDRNRAEENKGGGSGGNGTGDNGGINLLPLSLIEFRDLASLPFQPVIDDPVTGSGNDDLWAIDDEKDKDDGTRP